MARDYSLLIGKKFGDREILDVIKKKQGGEYKNFAICKCKCGSVDEVPLTRLRTGQQSRCKNCASANRNKSTGIKNISYNRRYGNFMITIERNGQKVVRYVHTLNEAILTKKQLLKHFEKYGCFDTEKLNDSYYTREPQQKRQHGKRRLKDYSYLIGQKIGDYEIIHVDSTDIERRARVVRLRDKQGYTKETKIKIALESLKRATRESYAIKSNTNIKNISYNKWTKRYYVNITRNGILKIGSSKDLEEAIKIKERILKEFEEENVSNG